MSRIEEIEARLTAAAPTLNAPDDIAYLLAELKAKS